MPRTTMHLEEEAMKAAKAYSARHRVTLGKAVSELVRRAAEQPVTTDDRNGLRVVRLASRSPKVTAARVDRLLDEQP